MALPITGTFLDEITHDIPSQNWGPREWERDFDAMKSVGIDTVILIRAGYKDRSVFPSRALASRFPMRPCYEDLLDLFLTLAERRGMRLFFGLYDSGRFWQEGRPDLEIEVNKAVTEEAVRSYGARKAFAGWYLSHEIHGQDDRTTLLLTSLAAHLKKLKPMPILMSPYVRGRMQFDRPVTPEEHEKEWDAVLGSLSGMVDIVAFQDGQVAFHELPVFLEINNRLARKHGLAPWSNVESFERGMPINFLPITWSNLRYKMDVAEKAGVEKLITFEFSHFLSPHSCYPQAHGLSARYREYIGA